MLGKICKRVEKAEKNFMFFQLGLIAGTLSVNMKLDIVRFTKFRLQYDYCYDFFGRND